MTDVERREMYLTRQNAARAYGLDAVLSVRLCVPKDMEHLLTLSDNGESTVLVFYNSMGDMAVVMEKVAEEHDPMIVKWVLPIGKIPKLLPPPN